MSMRLCSFLIGFLPLAATADRFANWDKNGDGKLQREELPPNVRGNFARVDTNKDGTISRAEDEAFAKGLAESPRREVEDQPDQGYRILRNLDYVGEGNPRQALDLFLPVQPVKKTEELRPLLIFIHGGAWQSGSKEGGLRRLLPFLQSGDFAGAALNYRLTGEAGWPAQLHDCKAAIRWLRAHAGEYGYDADKLAVWGTSAGGHLAAMLGVCGDVPELEGNLGTHLAQTSRVTGVINYFGPSSLLTMDDFPSRINHSAAGSPEGRLVGGALADKKEIARNASPVTHVSISDAPILIAHGSKDMLVPHHQSIEFTERLKETGVPVVFITLEEAGHGFRSLELQRRVSAFLGKHLRGKDTEVSSEKIAPGQ